MNITLARLIAGSLLAIAIPALKAADPIPTALTGTFYSQNFDSTFPSSGSTGSAVPPGWGFVETGANANTTYGLDNGSSTAGNTYDFVNVSGTGKAFGTLQDGSLVPTIGAAFTNNTGGIITSLKIVYTGEQWRYGGSSTASNRDRLDFQYSTTAVSLALGLYTDFNTLDFSSKITGGGVNQLDGTQAANETSLIGLITGLTIAPGATFYIRWLDFDLTANGGNDDGLAIDNFSIAAFTAVPEASTWVIAAFSAVMLSWQIVRARAFSRKRVRTHRPA